MSERARAAVRDAYGRSRIRAGNSGVRLQDLRAAMPSMLSRAEVDDALSSLFISGDFKFLAESVDPYTDADAAVWLGGAWRHQIKEN